ncbi:hypothetical protein DRE_02973 [Drechslerella stenobrocha 248]|uniref:DUF6606 domain-containing protein n=1 Tax=Drechslerella stenobrocha 248 TaxID=1043628 RepID=W7I6G3_9PEZI|nr:hypothetical protein DRE_02973 [Drechslerella stenobrocha 248]
MAKVHDPDAEFPRQVMDGIMGLANGDAFALHVFRQNAGVIIRRVQDDLRFEVFEASPIPAAVVGCKGRLRCNFPGPVTAIPCQVARDPLFLNELGNFLQHMDTRQFTEETLSKSRKGGNDLSETRDTADPRYIIELLTGIMRGIGKEVETVNIITKNLRDEVNWKSALSPWRRSGLWLVVRVGLQTTLGRDEYKFFMLRVIGAVLAQAIHSDIDSYSISCIRQKLARRAFKLGEANIPQELLAQTLRIAQEGHSMLSYRWSQTIAGSERLVQFDQKLTTPASVLDNTYLKLRDASAWIENRITAYNSLIGRASSVQDPQELARHVDSSSFPQLRGGTEIESAISLIDFELWVQQHLEAWCSGSIRHSHGRLWVIEELAANIKQYHKEASKAYTTHSLLDASKMALTILEMWIELDKLVCEEEPLLSDYSPEIPINILDPILLVQRGDMDRVVKVEDYLRQRHTTSRVSSRPSMFDEKVSAKSFAVNYYNQSSALKNLRSRIVRQAESDKERKKQELLRQNQEYKELMADSQLLSCDYGINQKGQSYHCKWCDKCACKREAGRLTINPHEWPLPAYETDSQKKSSLGGI